MIYVSDNVLTPEVLQSMYRHKKGINSIVTKYGDTWESMCKRMPIVKAPDIFKLIIGRRKRAVNESDSFFDNLITEDDWDDWEDDNWLEEIEEYVEKDVSTQDNKIATAEQYSIDYYPKPYCDIVEDMEKACIEFSLLELWANNGRYDKKFDHAINSLTTEDILNKINNVNISGVFLIERNFHELLSEIGRNSTGHIVSAKATLVRWFGEMNTTEALLHPAPKRGEPISKETLEFEGELIKVLLNQTDYPKGLKGYPNVNRSFGDIAGSTILGDLKGLAIGYMILMIYVQIMLGRFNCVEQRSLLTIVGIFGVIMGIIMSYGICSAIGLFFGPMHNVLPFLLLGIGIDDMFVIVQCWDVLESKYKEIRRRRGEEEESVPLSDRFGRTMSSAGVAITVTSFTDIVGK